MIDRYEQLKEMRKNWQKDRPIMSQANSDLLNTWSLLLGEVHEAGDEVVAVMTSDLESSHVLIDKLAKELDDVFWFLLEMYAQIGVDLFDSVRDKMAQNMIKHPSKNYQVYPPQEFIDAHPDTEWSYQSGVMFSREEWKARKGYNEYYSVDENGQDWNI